jgi:hypothetical protein
MRSWLRCCCPWIHSPDSDSDDALDQDFPPDNTHKVALVTADTIPKVTAAEPEESLSKQKSKSDWESEFMDLVSSTKTSIHIVCDSISSGAVIDLLREIEEKKEVDLKIVLRIGKDKFSHAKVSPARILNEFALLDSKVLIRLKFSSLRGRVLRTEDSSLAAEKSLVWAFRAKFDRLWDSLE